MKPVLYYLHEGGKYALFGVLFAGLLFLVGWKAIRDIPEPPPAAALLHKDMCEDDYSEVCEPISTGRAIAHQ